MGKHVFYTKITPLPSNIPRLLALDLLHSHDEFIRLNPLVTDVKPIDAPRDAEGDEFFSNWYRIHEIMKLTGVKMKYDFKGCFHNQQWGMQSHILGPAGIEMRNKYRIGGNQPGEPREARELGVNTPQDGLYLREDISFTCSALFAGFVKKGMQEASQVMIDRMARKAELLDEGKLHAMFENGKLKTARPTQPAPPVLDEGERNVPSPSASPSNSPNPGLDSPYSQQSEFPKPGFANYNTLAGRDPGSARASYASHYQQSGYGGPNQQRPVSDMQGYDQNQNKYQNQGQNGQNSFVSELPGSYYSPQQVGGAYQQSKPSGGPMVFRSELPGDSTYYESPNQRSSPQPGSASLSPPPQSSPRMPSNQSSPYGSARNSGYQVSSPDQSQQQQQSQSRGNSYQVTNADQQRLSNPSTDQRSSSNSNIQEWQRSVQNDTPIDENYYHNSRHSHGGGYQSLASPEPDHNRMSNLSITQNASSNDRAGLPSQNQTRGAVANCPVCNEFAGDEAAVSHHVANAHFQD